MNILQNMMQFASKFLTVWLAYVTVLQKVYREN